MFVVVNALKSITRSKGRNILIGIIVVAIATASCVALAIQNAADEAKVAGMNLLNITASISVDTRLLMEKVQSEGGDMDDMREMMAAYPNLKLPELMVYADSNLVKNFYYTGSISLNGDDTLEAYGSEATSGERAPGGMGGFGGRVGGMIGGGMVMGDFTITGCSAEDAMIRFINGSSFLSAGEMFDADSADKNALISYELAVFNGLSVGDTIVLSNPNADDETYSLMVSGIYTNSSTDETSNTPRFSTAMDPANLIYISYSALEEILGLSEDAAVIETDDNGNEVSSALTEQLSGTFVFASVEDYEGFKTELTVEGLSDYYTLSSSDISNYEASLIPLHNLSKFAATLLQIVLAVGGIILVVINVFNIRERQYEVGVLTAIGIRKSKVALQFVTELLLVTFIAIVIGTGIGAVASVPVSNSLLSAQIEQMESQANNQNSNFGRGMGGINDGGESLPGRGNTMLDVFRGNRMDVNYLDQMNATVNFPIVMQLMWIGIFLTLISSFAAVVFVMRYEPLTILANRT